jgi:predicted O-methyltransferase YrrM
MEVGVYDGDNAVDMVKAASEAYPKEEVEYYGFDFFTNYTRARISSKIDFTGCKYRLYEGDTLVTLPLVIGGLPLMDLIFIDGGKSYTEARSDWEHSNKLLHERSVTFIHNYEFYGVKRMVDGIPKSEYEVQVLREEGEGLVAQLKLRTKSCKQ